MVAHLSHVRGDPEPGRYYMVPCVHGMWNGVVKDWPIIGTLHRDAEFFGFDIDHYHLDFRFLRTREVPLRSFHDSVSATVGSPLQTSARINENGLSRPRLMKRRCRVARFDMTGFRTIIPRQLSAMAAAHPQAIRGEYGWICPHRNFDLRNVTPEHGAITCPMHGLRFCAKTGRCLDGAKSDRRASGAPAQAARSACREREQ